MALAATAYSNIPIIKRGHKNYLSPNGLKVVMSTITLDTDYVDGGWVVAAANFGMAVLIAVLPLSTSVTGADGASYGLNWDSTAGTLKAHVGATGIEAADGLNGLSGLTAQVLAIGY